LNEFGVNIPKAWQTYSSGSSGPLSSRHQPTVENVSPILGKARIAAFLPILDPGAKEWTEHEHIQKLIRVYEDRSFVNDKRRNVPLFPYEFPKSKWASA
jgi:hypothetical protein